MNRRRWEQVDHLLEEALDLDQNQRTHFLDCLDDEPLRKELVTLLNAHLKAGKFLETPPGNLSLGLLNDSPLRTLLPRKVGPYKILDSIGAGGMGEIYLAEDTRLGRRIALKRLPYGLMHDPESRARLLREAQLASALDHPNICTIYEIEESDGEYFIAMQYVEGNTLSGLIREQPLPLNSLLSLSLQVGDALAAAHSRGIIHRDIKSSNIMITPEGQAKILDFGVAKLIEDKARPSKTDGEQTTTTTATGVMGTPSYMSPEQARGEQADYPGDIFSFGVVLYEMATGRLPFEEKTQAETLHAVIEKPHVPVRQLNQELPQKLEKIVDRALAKDPAGRYNSIQEMMTDLREVADHIPLFRRPTVLITLAIVGVILLVVGLTFSSLRTKDGTNVLSSPSSFVVPPGVKPAAYEAYLRGKNYLSLPNPKEEELRLGITMFERAIELDDHFAPAYAMLSKAHAKMYHTHSDRSSTRLAQAKQAADQAFLLQPDLPLAHIAMGWYHYWGFRNYEAALREFSIAQKVVPNDTNLLMGFASIYKRQGKFTAALREFKKILDVDPRNSFAAGELGILYDTIGRYSEAQRYFDLGISLRPDHSGGYVHKVQSYLAWTGDLKGARAMLRKIPDQEVRNNLLRLIERLDRNYQAVLDLLPLPALESFENAIIAGDCYRLMNRLPEARDSYEAARQELDDLLQKNPDDASLFAFLGLADAGLDRKEDAIQEAMKATEIFPVSLDANWGPYFVTNLTIVYVMVGEYEAALDQIEYLLSIPTWGGFAPSVPLLRIDPTWDPLRDQPGFQKILEKHRHTEAASL